MVAHAHPAMAAHGVAYAALAASYGARRGGHRRVYDPARAQVGGVELLCAIRGEEHFHPAVAQELPAARIGAVQQEHGGAVARAVILAVRHRFPPIFERASHRRTTPERLNTLCSSLHTFRHCCFAITRAGARAGPITRAAQLGLRGTIAVMGTIARAVAAQLVAHHGAFWVAIAAALSTPNLQRMLHSIIHMLHVCAAKAISLFLLPITITTDQARLCPSGTWRILRLLARLRPQRRRANVPRAPTARSCARSTPRRKQ